MDIEILRKHLEDEDFVKILNHCREPKTYKEMKTAKIKEGKLFQVLKALKINEALLFADGKYYSSPAALKLI
ncbi:hypothetical protein KAW53_00775 [Candidatus Bathyarchaeota archaeon]|jgi:hypothetical protein|nr:hypothetical protein [Candidatus Bathyarchaeota archaeon]